MEHAANRTKDEQTITTDECDNNYNGVANYQSANKQKNIKKKKQNSREKKKARLICRVLFFEMLLL